MLILGFFQQFFGLFRYLEKHFLDSVGIFPSVSGSRKTMVMSVFIYLSRVKSWNFGNRLKKTTPNWPCRKSSTSRKMSGCSFFLLFLVFDQISRKNVFPSFFQYFSFSVLTSGTVKKFSEKFYGLSDFELASLSNYLKCAQSAPLAKVQS